jgi:hypothetical protein
MYHGKESWQAVSLYDSENYFRGPAVFETEIDAKKYLKIYQSRLTNWNEQNQSNNYVSKSSVQLRIFKESERPPVDLPFYHFRKHN